MRRPNYNPSTETMLVTMALLIILIASSIIEDKLPPPDIKQLPPVAGQLIKPPAS